jgi:hypothetical protein
MTHKRLSLWPDGHVMVERYKRESEFFHKVTPASYKRIKKLSWGAKINKMEVTLCTDDEGLLFVAIDGGK